MASRQYLQLRGAKVTAVAFHQSSGVLVTAYSSGIFELHQMPDFTHIQILSATHNSITAVTFNGAATALMLNQIGFAARGPCQRSSVRCDTAEAGNFIAVGSAELGQLLVWDWRQETYVLKQQGHSTHVAAVAFSPDGSQLATAGDDSKARGSVLVVIIAEKTTCASLLVGQRLLCCAGQGLGSVQRHVCSDLYGSCCGSNRLAMAPERQRRPELQPGRHSAGL